VRSLLLSAFTFVSMTLAASAFNPKDLWKNVRTYQANFTQEVISKTMPGSSPETTQGTIFLARPNQLRWEIKVENQPPEVQILANNELKYIHRNRRGTTLVDVYKNVSKAPGSKPLSFLMGKAQLDTLYKVKVIGETDKQVTLELKPKEAGLKETYIAEIDKRGYFLLSLTTDTTESKVVMKFSDPKLNIALDEKLFKYEPKSDDVVNRQ
jgi:outer membrane lipoprotein-sorting protein